nr:MAG TPA: protein of unknown function (DUF932) [Caudoviricetes sp.]
MLISSVFRLCCTNGLWVGSYKARRLFVRLRA